MKQLTLNLVLTVILSLGLIGCASLMSVSASTVSKALVEQPK